MKLLKSAAVAVMVMAFFAAMFFGVSKFGEWIGKQDPITVIVGVLVVIFVFLTGAIFASGEFS